MPGKPERVTRSKHAGTLSQPSSRAPSPVPSTSVEQMPVIVPCSNPEVRQAVRAMEGEMTLFSEILDKIGALSADIQEIKSQTQDFSERLARQEEATHQQGVETASTTHSSPQRALPTPTPEQAQDSSRDEQIATLRRLLKEKERELEEEKRKSRPRDAVQMYGRNDATCDLPRPLPRSRPSTPEPPVQPAHYPNNLNVPEFSHAPSYGRPASSQGPSQTVSYVLARETVPHFKGDTSASLPLKRNQEIEGWIRSIENLVKPPTSESFIQAARASCRGPADLIINSPLFDFIRDWDTFKAALRSKFRGTYTAADFYKVLYENRMDAGQAPFDFYQQLEGSVYQGYRDHKEAIGDPSELIRRVFLTGIPPWLRDFLALKEDCPTSQLAETAQRIWNSRNGIRHRESTSRHQSPNDFPGDDSVGRHNYPPRPPRTRDAYAYAVAAEQDEVASPYPAPSRWCEYHRSSYHNTSECRATASGIRPPPRSLTCFRCQRTGHLARECPFPTGQDGRAPSPSGSLTAGSRYYHQYTDGTPRTSDQCGERSRSHGTTSRGTQC